MSGFNSFLEEKYEEYVDSEIACRLNLSFFDYVRLSIEYVKIR